MPEQYVERPEFEKRLSEHEERVETRLAEINRKVESGFNAQSKRFDALTAQLAEREQAKSPKPWTVVSLVLTAVGVLGIPSLTAGYWIIVNIVETSALKARMDAHDRFLQSKSDELETGISGLRERVRGVESALVENETQHLWIRAALACARAELDIRTRAYVDGGRIVWPETELDALEGIGQAKH